MADPDRNAMLELAEERARAAAEPQPDLLGLPITQRVQDLRIKRERAGRPPGARNRRSEEVAQWIVDHIGDPLVMLAQVAVIPAEELAAAASCTVLEAMVEKRLAAIAVLPFLHRRQPLAVDVSNHRVVHLHIGEGPPPAAPGAGEAGVTLLGTVVDIEENQGVDDAADPAV